MTFNTAGTFYWQAVYSGDAKNQGSTSACTSETLVVNKKVTAINTAQNLIPNDAATLSNATSDAGRHDHVQPVQPERRHVRRNACVYTNGEGQRQRHV